MRRAVAVLLGMFLPILGLADAGLAQPAAQLQGTIQSVDCQNQTVALAAAGGSNVAAATDSTAVLVNSTSVRSARYSSMWAHRQPPGSCPATAICR